MQTREVMTRHAEFLTQEASLTAAAEHMRKVGTGFLPVSDRGQERLVGAVTDRDIVVRGIARGLDPASTPLSEVMSNGVLYCFEGDKVDDVAKNMQANDCYRLVVLDTPETKRMTGVVSLNDIARHDKARRAGEAASGIHLN